LAEALAPTDPNAALYCLRHLAVGMFSRPHEAHGVLNGAPHSVQNFNASRVSVLRFSQSTCQFPFTHSVGRAALWRPSLRGVEALVNQLQISASIAARLVAAIVVAQQSREADGGSELPPFPRPASCDLDGLAKAGLCLGEG